MLWIWPGGDGYTTMRCAVLCTGTTIDQCLNGWLYYCLFNEMNIKYGNGIELEVVGLSILYLSMSMGWRLVELLGNYWWRLSSIMSRCVLFLPSHLFRVAITFSSLYLPAASLTKKTFTFALSHLNRYMTSRWIEKLSLPNPNLLINGKFYKKKFIMTLVVVFIDCLFPFENILQFKTI